MSSASAAAAASPRKRRRVAESDEEGEGGEGMQQAAVPVPVTHAVPPASVPAAEDDLGDEDEEEEEVVELSSGVVQPEAGTDAAAGAGTDAGIAHRTAAAAHASAPAAPPAPPPAAPVPAPAPPAARRPLAPYTSTDASDGEEDGGEEDEVQITGMRTATAGRPLGGAPSASATGAGVPLPPRKRLRLVSSSVGASSRSVPPAPHSPTAPPLEGLSPPRSPEPPPTSPVLSASAGVGAGVGGAYADSSSASADVREELAVRRARMARRGAPRAPVAVARADSPAGSPPSAGAAAAAAPAPSSSQLRRRKGGPASAGSSSLASASLVQSYASSMGLSAPSLVAPELQWHEDNGVLCPANALDRADVERTFLQQVLVWDPFVISSSPAGTISQTAAEVPREMANFAKFLDPAVPLPVHFTTPLAYLGFFGPIVLDNFRAQISQTVALNLGEIKSVREQARGGKQAAPMPNVPSPAVSSAPVLSPQSERFRSCWTAIGMSPFSSMSGGGDDWFELRLRLTQQHRSLNEMCGADMLVLGIDEVPPVATAGKQGAQQQQQPPPMPVPATPSPSTLYVFAFLDGINPDGSGGLMARTRLYLPGVSSSLSPYVPAASASRNRFQLLYNRLSQAVVASSAPISEGGLNRHAHFPTNHGGGPGGGGGGGGGPRGGSSGAADPAAASTFPVFVTRIDTIITTIREYTALVKIGCLLGLRIQSELLRPTPAAYAGYSDSDDDDDALAGKRAARLIDLSSTASPPVSDGEVEGDQGPPALEDAAQRIKADELMLARQARKKRPAMPSASRSSQAHLDSPAWMGLPQGFREFVRTTLNEQQLKAVQVALHRSEKPGFTLLQGPPGTGKSKTVVALLNALHLGAFQRHYDALIAHLVDNQASSSSTTLKPRILVCAPSNTAVDELITRVLETGVQFKPPVESAASSSSASASAAASSLSPDQQLLASLRGHGGFVDGQRMRYRPDIVRVGHSESMRPELRASISLDALVDAYNKLTEAELITRLGQARKFVVDQENNLANLRVLMGKSQRVTADAKAMLDQLTALGHDVTRQKEFQQYEQQKAEQLKMQGAIASAYEKRTLAVQDAQRCDLALQFKQAGRASSAGGGGAGHTRKEREAALDALRITFLNQAQIVFCTLSGSGLELLSRLDQPFRALIVDEAAQCTEVAALIPLTHDVLHCILVGDPRQLPATIFSQGVAAKRMWERSLFERLEQAGHPMHALTVQYRMHGDIRQFPSDYFYQGMLTDAPYISTGNLYKQPYHIFSDYRPLVYFDLQSAAMRGGGGAGAPAASDEDPSLVRSLGNVKEATFIVNLLANLLRQFPHVRAKQVGIVTFYAKQKALLQDQLRTRALAEANAAGVAPNPPAAQKAALPATPLGASPLAQKHAQIASTVASSASPLAQSLLQIEVSTVDGFQGREKEIIVVSCVRGGAAGGLGFVDDVRRMNVALTRAKYACWVVGDSRALRKSAHWGAFLESVTRRQRYVQVQQTEFNHGGQPQYVHQQGGMIQQQQQQPWGRQSPQHLLQTPQQQQQQHQYQPSHLGGRLQPTRLSPQPLLQHPSASPPFQQPQSQHPQQHRPPHPSRQGPMPPQSGPFTGPPPPGFALVDLNAAQQPPQQQQQQQAGLLPMPMPPQQQAPPGFALLQLPPEMAGPGGQQAQFQQPHMQQQPQQQQQLPPPPPPQNAQQRRQEALRNKKPAPNLC